MATLLDLIKKRSGEVRRERGAIGQTSSTTFLRKAASLID
jgi:hypothetical protein